MFFSQAKIVVAIRIVTSLVTKHLTLEAIFHKDAVNMSNELDNSIKEADRAKRKWHEEVKDNEPIMKKAKDAFIKYKNLLIKRLPGVAKMDWQKSNVKPDIFYINFEKLIGFIEDNSESLPFADKALEELIPISDELDRELEEDREALRLYRNSVKVKNLALEKSEEFFLEVRRFIRRELGYKSPEYSQVKDKAIRKAAENSEQQDNGSISEEQNSTEENPESLTPVND